MIKSILLDMLLIFTLLCRNVWPGDTAIFSSVTGKCTLSVEANDEWRTLRLRAHHPEHKECRIAEAEMIASFEAAFLKTETPALTGDYSSLFIGRLVDYPWLSQFLADSAYNDLEWDSKNGKPVTTGINLYVSHILFRHKLLASIEAALAKAGFRIIGVTVEKVLVGNFNNVPMYRGDQFRGSVPYDAQVWFKLKKFENS